LRKTWMSLSLLAVLLATAGFLSIHQGRDTLVYVYSDSCGYCSAFSPTFEHVVAEYPDVKVERLHIQQADDYAEAKRLGAIGTPTVFVLHGGKVTAKLEGDVPERAFRRFLQKNLAGWQAE
jgi:thiol-disulfide isomerase/thioredoxin